MRNKALMVLRTASFLAQYFFKKFLYIFNRRLPGIKARYGHSFPAIHLKKMDSFDYLFNFSSELLTLGLAIIIVVMNVAAFGLPGFHKENLSDQSLAAKFLALHSGLNNKLYVHNSAVRTSVVAGSNFASTAYAAEESLNAAGTLSYIEDGKEEDFESVITKPKEDARDLLQNQIQVYKTEKGDTLYSVAKKFGLYTNTLAWSNGLKPGDTIKEGWYLIISKEANTVTVKTSAADSIPGLAKKFNVSEDTIINANALSDAQDIDPGIYLYIPGGTVKEAPKPAPVVSKPSANGRVAINSGAGNRFPWGQCTWYAASQLPWVRSMGIRGNAKDWLNSARKVGATVSSAPSVGSVGVNWDNKYYGHVFVVREVLAGGKIKIQESNYAGKGVITTRIIPVAGVRGFITP